MRRLILMRHAKSDWSHAGLADHDRPLNKRGIASAAALGDWLRDKGYLPDQVLSSSAERTGQTLQGLNLHPASETHFSRALYHAGAEEMLAQLRAATGQCVLMIGHNPGICEFAHRLVNDVPGHPRFADYPTCATLVCDFDLAKWSELGWHQGLAVDFTVPRDLIG